MAINQTIESPNFEKINKEAGQFTSDAISLLWNAINDTRKTERMDFRRVSERMEPKVLTIDAGASVDNLDLDGASVISFIGASAQNFTGMRAPEPGKSRVVLVQVSGAGTITAKHNATSSTENQLVNTLGVDKALATNAGIVYVYTAAKWRQVV